MGVVIPIITSVLGVIAFVVYLVIRSHQISEEKKLVGRPNMPFIEIQSNKRKSFLQGYGRGVIDKQEPRPNGTWYIKFLPDDVVQGENVESPDFKEIIVNKNYIDRSAEGENYARRSCVTILPFDNADLPKKFRGTEKGKYLEAEGLKAFATELIGNSLKVNKDAVFEAMKDFAFGDISKADQKRIKELSKKEKRILSGEDTSEENKP